MVSVHDHGRITLVIKMLGLMCDGQYREMQNYLREQKESLAGVNIVKEIVFFLYEYSKRRVITPEVLPLLTEAFQTLIELCSGNFENSEVIFTTQILSLINFYLQIDITKIFNDENFSMDKKKIVKLRINALKLKAAVVDLLEAMLEKVSIDTDRLTLQIAEGLDSRALQYSMVDFFTLKDDKELKVAEEDDNALRALFTTYSVIKYLTSSEANTASKFG